MTGFADTVRFKQHKNTENVDFVDTLPSPKEKSDPLTNVIRKNVRQGDVPKDQSIKDKIIPEDANLGEKALETVGTVATPGPLGRNLADIVSKPNIQDSINNQFDNQKGGGIADKTINDSEQIAKETVENVTKTVNRTTGNLVPDLDLKKILLAMAGIGILTAVSVAATKEAV